MAKNKDTMIVLNKIEKSTEGHDCFNISIFRGNKIETKVVNSYEELIDTIKKTFKKS